MLIEEKRHIPKELEQLFQRASASVRQLLQQVMMAFAHFNAEEAHQALETKPKAEKLLAELDHTLLELDDPHLAYHLGIVADSVSRVKDYAANIAEVALNAAALRQA